MFVNLSGFVKQVGRKQKNYMAAEVKYRKHVSITIYYRYYFQSRDCILPPFEPETWVDVAGRFDLGKGMLDCPTCSKSLYVSDVGC